MLTVAFKYVNNAFDHEMTCEIRNYNMTRGVNSLFFINLVT